MYDRLAQYYDWEHREFDEDLPLYLGYARSVNAPVLDVGCGTGRVALALAEAGHFVVGIDSSPAMLALAVARLGRSAAGGRVRLVGSDVRTLALRSRFGMAVVALGSFHHLLTGEDQRRALGRLADHLQPGGLLLLDLLNPSPEWLSAGDGTLVLQHAAPYPGPQGPDWMTKVVARTTHFETQLEQLLLIYDRSEPDGLVNRQCVPMEMRLLFRYEAEMLLEGAGFRIRERHGNYDLEEYHSSSPRMIFVAEKR